MAVTRALAENRHKFSTTLVPKAVLGLFALLCGNSYIVGINQIYDVEIDEVGVGQFRRFSPQDVKIFSRTDKQTISSHRVEAVIQTKCVAYHSSGSHNRFATSIIVHSVL